MPPTSSARPEGWSALPDIYDDGGISGGTLDRPALQRLLADVAAGRIDIIVVYKVDRLTRSLLDFAKLVEAFDKAGTSFVSITQSFNTTTSMGRLTLNMLLSFAQFEREVTAERIRDKLAASKAKGMWMGGVPPLGYRPDGRTLAIVEGHAALVRHLFARYAALGSVRLLQQELVAQRICVPHRSTVAGNPVGGGPFTRGQLYHLLQNLIYRGEIRHKEKVYPGLHPPITTSDMFVRTQSLLADNLQGSRTRARAASPSLLAGKVFDANGEPLIATHACKGKVRHRYYVSRALHHATSDTGLRVPARELESLVADEVTKLFTNALALAAAAWLDVPVEQLRDLDAACRTVQADLARHTPTILPRLIARVTAGADGVTITCSTTAVADVLTARLVVDAPATIELSSTARITRSGRAIRLVHDNGSAARQPVDQALLRLILKARRWWAELREGELSPTDIARREGVTSSYVCRVLRVAFLSPAVVQGVLAGRQRVGTNVALLRFESSVPASWSEQSDQLMLG